MARGEPLPAVAGEWNVASDRTAGLIREVEVAQQQQLATDGAALAAGARSAALRDGIVVALLVVLTVLMLVFVARSLVRPLRTLRTAASIACSDCPRRSRMAIVDGRPGRGRRSGDNDSDRGRAPRRARRGRPA
jgi:hypothetical protein